MSALKLPAGILSVGTTDGGDMLKIMFKNGRCLVIDTDTLDGIHEATACLYEGDFDDDVVWPALVVEISFSGSNESFKVSQS